MDEEVLNKLNNELYSKGFKQLEEGLLFTEIYDGLMVINWSVGNDLHIDYEEVKEIIDYSKKYLKKHHQEGFLYTATNSIEV